MADMYVVLDLCFPPTCLSCGLMLRDVRVPELCAHCGIGLSPLDPDHATRGSPPITAAYDYQGPLTHALARLKYHGDLSPLGPLARGVADALIRAGALESFDLVCIAPTHWRRRIWRGYDHLALLAEYAWPHLHHPPPLRLDLLYRRHAVVAQAALDASSRAVAQRHSVALTRAAKRSSLRGARVLVLDDVTTTGATMRACFAPLLQARVHAVAGFALLRA